MAAWRTGPDAERDQRAVEVDEDGTGGVGHVLNLPPGTRATGTGWAAGHPASRSPRSARRAGDGSGADRRPDQEEPDQPLDAAKGPPGGRGGPFALTQRGKEGDSYVLWS